MAVSSNVFHTATVQAYSGGINYQASGGNTQKMALFSSAPALTTALYSSLTGEITGTGYTAGGVALASKTVTATEANSWATAWAATTAYSVGTVIRPGTGNGFLYVNIAIAGTGTSGASTPTFPTVVGQTVVDNSGANQITWSCLGEAITVFSSAAVSWSTATFSATYGVIYDTTSSANIAMINFGAAQSPSAGTFTVTPDSTLGWFYVSPA